VWRGNDSYGGVSTVSENEAAAPDGLGGDLTRRAEAQGKERRHGEKFPLSDQNTGGGTSPKSAFCTQREGKKENECEA